MNTARATLLACFAFGAAMLSAPTAMAQDPSQVAARPKDVPAKIESYYRVKWGSLPEFIALYERNQKPLLEEMRKAGFILSMKTEYPFTHMAGGPRWDVRVAITYRDGAAAINDPAWVSSWAAARKRLFKDAAGLDAEEARRFSLLEDHWDVVVSDYPE